MPVRTISTSIKLDGEQEFKKQLGNVNRELKNLDSEMKLVTAQFEGQANSMEALTAKGDLLQKEYDQTAEKVKALEKALEDSTEAYGEADARTDKYRQSLNRAKTDLVNLERELQDNAKYLDEARESADKAAKSIDGFGNEVKDIDSGSSGGLGGLVESLGSLQAVAVGGAVVGGVKEIGEALFEVVEASEEYRKIMGTLEVSSQAAGYSAEETAATYGRLQSVLGDTQTAATATANLQAIGLSQEDLMSITDMAIGAWAKYGDSIPIDSLAESINETIQAGEVTGTFADVLNWAGESEDAFNEKLAAASTTAEKADLVMQAMAEQGLTEAADAWMTVNEDIVKANESQAAWDEALAGLGEVLAPARDALRNFGAEALEWVTERIKDAVEWIQNLIGWFKNLGNAEDESASEFSSRSGRTGRPDGSHAAGLSYVPFDGYMAELHQGEMVLTAAQANAIRVGGMAAPRQDYSGLTAGIVNAMKSAQNGFPNQPITLNATITMDGAVVARKQFQYNQAEAQRHGRSLVNK